MAYFDASFYFVKEVHEEDNKEAVEEDFEMDIYNQDKDPVKRVVREAERIEKTLNGEQMPIYKDLKNKETVIVKATVNLLNSRREFFVPNLPSAAVTNVRNNLRK